MATLPTVPTFVAGDTSLTKLQQLAGAVGFLADVDVRPAWHLIKTATQAIPAATWTSVGYDTAVYDNDSTFNANFLAGNGSTFEGGIANWTNPTNCSVAQSSAQAHGGTNSLAITSTAAGTMTAASCATGSILTQGLRCSPGDVININEWVRAFSTVETMTAQVEFFTSGGVTISTLGGTGVADTSTGWTNITGALTAPATAAAARAKVAATTTAAGGEVHYLDDVSMSLNGSVTIQTQGFYMLESCWSLNGQTGYSPYEGRFLLTGGGNNPNLAYGATLAFGHRTTPTHASGTDFGGICSDQSPVCLYPGDKLQVQVQSLLSATLNILANTSFLVGRQVCQFTGYWMAEGT